MVLAKEAWLLIQWAIQVCHPPPYAISHVRSYLRSSRTTVSVTYGVGVHPRGGSALDGIENVRLPIDTPARLERVAKGRKPLLRLIVDRCCCVVQMGFAVEAPSLRKLCGLFPRLSQAGLSVLHHIAVVSNMPRASLCCHGKR